MGLFERWRQRALCRRITSEMLERGARASWNGPPAWEDLPPAVRDGRRNMARRIVHATLFEPPSRGQSET